MRLPVKMWLVFMLLTSCAAARAQQPEVLLWPNGAPGSEGKTAPEVVKVSPVDGRIVTSVNFPSVTVYLPAAGKATGAAVVILPGGGHFQLSIDLEGFSEAAWLSAHGVAAFVVKYRLAREPGSTYTVEGDALPDTQRAIRLVRSRAAEWGVDPNRIGVMGFSAGGQLAAMASTQFDAGNPTAADPIDRQSSKPDFQALIYPGLPPNVPVTKDTPPAFLACGGDDRTNISQGVPQLYLAMKQAGMTNVELHVFAGVGHAFGLRATNTGNITTWLEMFVGWLGSSGFLKQG